jgi:hypothetical protein
LRREKKAGLISAIKPHLDALMANRLATVLQPSLDLLDRARDFSQAGPVLIITAGWCDPLRVRRDYAVLVPPGASLPFVPRWPVFWGGEGGGASAPYAASTAA